MKVHAYRALVDGERYAIVHASDLIEAGNEFRKALPDINRPFSAARLPFPDEEREPGVQVFPRQFPLQVKPTTNPWLRR